MAGTTTRKAGTPRGHGDLQNSWRMGLFFSGPSVMVSGMNGAIRCGSFAAMPLAGSKDRAVWEVTCDWLPDFRQEVVASESEIADCIIRLQAEYRKEKDK